MTREELLAKIDEYQLEIPFSDDLSPLGQSKFIEKDNITLKNSIAIHPMEGHDGTTGGAPTELTERRYLRFADSGCGLIWFEATAVQEDARAMNRQLWLREENVDDFKRLVDKIHNRGDGVPIILQLTHSGRFSKPFNKPAPVISYHNPIMNRNFHISEDYPVVDDDYLDRLEESFQTAARLAHEAGFDGVDIKACHRYLLGELLSAYTRDGKHGGLYENRTRLFKNIIKNVKSEFGSSLAVTARLGVFDAIDYPYGFGVDKDDYTKPDLEEPIRLIDEINQLGVNLINFTMGTPYVNPHVNRPYNKGSYLPPEHPLAGVNRLIKYAGIIQKQFPSIAFVGTGYSYLGYAAQYVAAGALKNGMITSVGFGRMALAYDTFASDMIAGNMNTKKLCITCGKCSELMRAGAAAGCPIRDSKVYAPIYKEINK